MSEQNVEKVGLAKRLPVSSWHAERGCMPGGFCRIWGKRHPRTTTQAARLSLPSETPTP